MTTRDDTDEISIGNNPPPISGEIVDDNSGRRCMGCGEPVSRRERACADCVEESERARLEDIAREEEQR